MTEPRKANRRDNRQISFRLSEDEYGQLASGATALGVSVSKLVKRRVMGMQIVSPRFTEEVAQKLRADLCRIGNNVNQLARRANRGEQVDGWNDVLKELREAWRLLR